MIFELSCKAFKDYLETNGFMLKSPRGTIKQAFQSEVIDNGESWLKMLDDRKLTTHLYDEIDNENFKMHINQIGIEI